MKTEETKELDLKEVAFNLSQSIMEKRRIHYAITVAIGALLNQFDDRDIDKPIDNAHDMNQASILFEETRKIAIQIDTMMDKLNRTLFVIKSEN